MMKTVVVAVVGRELLTNISDLFPSFKSMGYHVILQDRPEANVVAGKVITNFDVLIEGTVNRERTKSNIGVTWDLLVPDRYIQMNRCSKSLMSVLFARHARPTTISYKVISAYRYHKTSSRMMSRDLDLDKHYVIKPEHGARGLGHLVFSPKTAQVETILAALASASDFDDFEARLTKAGASGVTIHRGQERHDRESLEALQSQELLIQELIPDITEQYRVVAYLTSDADDITGRECKYHIVKRNISDSSDPSGFAPLGPPKHDKEDKEGFYRLLHERDPIDAEIIFDAVVEEVLMEESFIASFDVFFTPSSWGFLEYSNQFGVIGMGCNSASESTRKALIAEMTLRDMVQ